MKPVWRREPVVEAALASFAGTLSGLGVWAELAGSPWRTPPVWLAAVLTVAPNAVLVLRRRRPATVAVLATVLVLGYHLAGFPGLAPAFSLFVAYYSAAAYARTWRWLALPVALALASSAIPVLPPHGILWWNPAEYGPTVGLLCMVGLGAAVRQHRLDLDAQAQSRLTEQRLSIARELHDVLAHTISVITVQGGLALDALDDDPEQTRGALLAMRGAARQAQAELRATLAVLRDGAPAPPQPRLPQLPELVEQARAAGLRVELRLPAELSEVDSPLSPAVELTAYRIVQEALTNAVRHAGAQAVWVDLRHGDGTLQVEVRDDGRGLGSARAGQGLRGMRERAESVGGSLALGDREGGGCRVTARLPT